MKILTIVGARPQFVKAAVVSRSIAKHNQQAKQKPIEEIILHTGQHYDPSMSDVFFKEMGIPQPQVNLSVGSGRHGAMTGEMLKGIEIEIIDRKPDLVLVYGDTNSTLAGALAAVKLHVPVAHVEAGLRSFNPKMPEEINRVLTDRVSNQLFCPSRQSVTWLAAEGITKGVVNTGDVMFDAFLAYLPNAHWPSEIQKPVEPYILATLHRAENTDDLERLSSIAKAFEAIKMPIVLPVHPRTSKVFSDKKMKWPRNVVATAPQPYFALLALLKGCQFVMTDSGGLQKEAYFAGKKAVVLRDQTEWVELIESKDNVLVGAETEKIIQGVQSLGETAVSKQHIYGDGAAGDKIVRSILDN